MADLKTKKTDHSVDAFLLTLEDEVKRADARSLLEVMREATGEPPAMWGASIVGFGHRRLRYESGREIDWMVVGFAPRKSNFSLYLPGGIEPLRPLLERLGPHKTGEGCIYIKRLQDVEINVLRDVVRTSLQSVEAG